MNKTNDMHGSDREKMSDSSKHNGNMNDLDSRSNIRDNSGMHAGGSEGSSYKERQSTGNSSQYGSKSGSYWQEEGSNKGSENRMNDDRSHKEHEQHGQQGQYGQQNGQHGQQGQYGQQNEQHGQQGRREHDQSDSLDAGKEGTRDKESAYGSSVKR